MKFLLTILLLFTSVLFGQVLNIDDKTKIYDVLPSAQIYIDKTRKLTIDDITTRNIQFEENDKSLLGYGYSPNFDVWVKFTLKNDTNKPIQKVLEYGNPLSTNVDFFDISKNAVLHDGLANINTTRKSINPVFTINLIPNESKTYYIKTSSYITTLIVKLNLYNHNYFYTQEIKYQGVLFLFFGAMFILTIYNIFIYAFSRDISYLYYSMYILGVIIHHLMYIGLAYIYILPEGLILLALNYASIIVAFPILSLTLFVMYFLKTKQYPVIHKILNILLSLVVFSLFVLVIVDNVEQYKNLPSMILFVYISFVTIYATFKKNRQAYFIFTGWSLIFAAIILMYLSSINIFNIYQYFPYFIEFAFIAEAVIFSVALSDKINTLQTKLIVQKRTENERLEIQVLEKTKDLNISLEEKTLLLQELNHRVKNNMQMIISLIRLQTNDIDDKKIQNLFLTTQNRLNAMSQLHELLYQKDDISYINAYEYFTTLIEELQETYSQNINIDYTISTDLETEQAISCGIILNELVTNSFKYAFNENIDDATIEISLIKEGGQYILIVKDNGVGYDQKTVPKSFGLILVTTLVESKLQGTITAYTQKGANIKIVWSEEDE